jgi:hypothetical protein
MDAEFLEEFKEKECIQYDKTMPRFDKGLGFAHREVQS